MLGWKILKQGFDYDSGYKSLSQDEEELILEVNKMFREKTKFKEINNSKQAKSQIKELIEQISLDNKLILDNDQEQYIINNAMSHVYGFMGLDMILQNDNIEEIAVNGLNKPVYVYLRNQGWKKTNLMYTELSHSINLINKMSRELGRRITYQSPRLNAVLPDGSRLHASIPPISNLELTIRKFRHEPFSVFELIKNGTISSEAMALVWMLMQSDLSIIVSGNTASGKTTTLNSIFSFVPATERILITEETPEINVPHEHKVNLISNNELNISISDLVADSLRMRPDRVIVGEVRTRNEVLALIDTILSGQARGCYATFHAQSGMETLTRLLSLGVLEIDLKSIDLIITQRRMLKYNIKTRKTYEIRKIVEISEVNKNNKIDINNTSINSIFSYDYDKDNWISNIKNSELINKACRSMGITLNEFKIELKNRKKFLDDNLNKKITFNESVTKIQHFAFGVK